MADNRPSLSPRLMADWHFRPHELRRVQRLANIGEHFLGCDTK